LLTDLASARSSRRVWEVLGAHETDPTAAWPDFGVDSPPFTEAAELSRAIEDGITIRNGFLTRSPRPPAEATLPKRPASREAEGLSVLARGRRSGAAELPAEGAQ
jgi:hypothetical protein